MPPRTRLIDEDDEPSTRERLYKCLKHFLHVVTMCCCAACVFASILLANSAVKDDKKSSQDKAFAVITYGFYVVLSLILFITELEPEWLVGSARKQGLCRLLHFWAGRGIVQLFLGTQLVHSSSMMDDVKALSIKDSHTIVEVFGWVFFGVGVLTALLGLACMQESDKAADLDDEPRPGKKGKALTPMQMVEKKLLYLDFLESAGVPHLRQATDAVLAEQAALQRQSGVGGWLRKKLGGGDDKPPPPRASTAAAPPTAPAAADSPQSVRAPLIQDVRQHASPPPPAPAEGAEGDFRDLRRQQEKEQEAEYARRYGLV